MLSRLAPRLRSRLPLVAVGLAALAFPFVTSPGKHFYAVLAVIYSLLALSLVVLTGWTGQISLGHAAFLGLGVYSGQRLLHAGVPFPAVLVLVGLASAALSLVLAVPSLPPERLTVIVMEPASSFTL